MVECHSTASGTAGYRVLSHVNRAGVFKMSFYGYNNITFKKKLQPRMG